MKTRRSLDHVFMSGDSTGGYLVLLTASVLASPELQEYYTEKGIDHICVEYVGTEKDLLHTFNVMHPEDGDGQLANGEMIEYQLGKIN